MTCIPMNQTSYHTYPTSILDNAMYAAANHFVHCQNAASKCDIPRKRQVGIGSMSLEGGKFLQTTQPSCAGCALQARMAHIAHPNPPPRTPPSEKEAYPNFHLQQVCTVHLKTATKPIPKAIISAFTGVRVLQADHVCGQSQMCPCMYLFILADTSCITLLLVPSPPSHCKSLL